MKIVSLKSAWKLIVLVVGFTIVLLGVALLVLPGPGWLVIVLGLAVLGSEFVWARRLLRRVKQGARAVTKKIRRELGVV